MQSSHNQKPHHLHHQTHNNSSFNSGEKQLQSRNSNVDETSTTSSSAGQLPNEEQDVLARKYGEVILNTFSTVAAALEYPKGMFNIIPKFYVYMN